MWLPTIKHELTGRTNSCCFEMKFFFYFFCHTILGVVALM